VQVLAKTQLAYIALQRGQYAAAIDAVRPLTVFNDRVNAQAINIGLEAMKKQKRYSDAVAFLQPVVDKFASDPFVNARYVEMLAAPARRTKPSSPPPRRRSSAVKNPSPPPRPSCRPTSTDNALALLLDAAKAKARGDRSAVRARLRLRALRRQRPRREKAFLTLLEKHPRTPRRSTTSATCGPISA